MICENKNIYFLSNFPKWRFDHSKLIPGDSTISSKYDASKLYLQQVKLYLLQVYNYTCCKYNYTCTCIPENLHSNHTQIIILTVSIIIFMIRVYTRIYDIQICSSYLMNFLYSKRVKDGNLEAYFGVICILRKILYKRWWIGQWAPYRQSNQIRSD